MPDDVIAVVVKYSTFGLINGTVASGSNTDAASVKSINDPENANDPVICASPVNGNASTPVNKDPLPTNYPENDPEYILSLFNELVTWILP